MRELFIDNFAGGGGASTGIALAIGRSVDIAINHDPQAIAMHRANHLDTKHYCESVWDIDPEETTGGQPVALCWFSPDCKHFSKAKGGKPKDKNIRGLAWVAARWAHRVHPRVIILENVEEFKTWGPLLVNGQPDPDRKGETFLQFVQSLRRQGYVVEWRELRACDYGAPTIRKRFFLVARCDGQPIVWPEPTHGDPSTLQVQAGLLKPWHTAAEIIDWGIPCPSIFDRPRPLAENTLRRIARGLKRFVIDSPAPFIIHYKFVNEPECAEKPLSTVTSVAGHYVITPFLTQYHSYSDDARGQAFDRPLLTLDTSNRYALCTAFLAKHFGGNYDGPGADVTAPVPTVTTTDHNALVTSHMIKLYGTTTGQPMTEPLHTITGGGQHLGEVRAFLLKYYGTGEGQPCDEPLGTVTTRDRFGLVMIHGEPWQIVDIGMRMLEPHELFAAQGFPVDYTIDHDADGNPITKSAQVARCGNAVCPPLAEALVRANLAEYCSRHKKAVER